MASPSATQPSDSAAPDSMDRGEDAAPGTPTTGDLGSALAGLAIGHAGSAPSSGTADGGAKSEAPADEGKLTIQEIFRSRGFDDATTDWFSAFLARCAAPCAGDVDNLQCELVMMGGDLGLVAMQTAAHLSGTSIVDVETAASTLLSGSHTPVTYQWKASDFTKAGLGQTVWMTMVSKEHVAFGSPLTGERKSHVWPYNGFMYLPESAPIPGLDNRSLSFSRRVMPFWFAGPPVSAAERTVIRRQMQSLLDRGSEVLEGTRAADTNVWELAPPGMRHPALALAARLVATGGPPGV